MIKSMTGFGRGDFQEDGNQFSVELKTVNHRYSEAYIKMPKQMTFLEDKVRELVTKAVSRGKIDVFVSYENSGDNSKEVTYDESLANSYIKTLETIRDTYLLKDDISVSVVAGFPNVMKTEKPVLDEEKLWEILKTALNNAMNNLIGMRKAEGEKLKENLLEKIASMEKTILKIHERSPEIVREYKIKLTDRITELLENQVVDESRIAMEVAVFADRCGIDEELVRLTSHINQTRETLESQEPIGRKLDFLIQEMNREVNTIGSKANDLDITKNVVELKCELEKIREQVQNIE